MIYPHEITLGDYYKGSALTTGNRLVLELDPVDNTRTNTLTLTFKGGRITGNSISVSIQGQVRASYSTSSKLTTTINPAKPLTIEVANYDGQVDISITSTGETRSPHRLALLALAPRREYVSAILDLARLDQFLLPDPNRIVERFILDADRLDYGVLEENPTLEAWQNILDPATRIEVTRGLHYNGMTGKGETGILTAEIYNDLDPRASGLTRGTPIILQDTTTRRRLFTGQIISTRSTPAKDGTFTVTITAADRGYQLAQTAKYQDTRTAPASWESVAVSLLKSHPTSITTDADRPLIGSVVKEATLTEYLDMLAATAGVTWWITANDRISLAPRPPQTALAELIADTSPSTALPALHLSDADATLDWVNTISHIEATNNEAERGEDGWENHTRTLRATSETNLATYGENRASVETIAANPAELQALLDSYMTNYEPDQVLRSATITPWHTAHHIRRPDEITTLAALDVMDAVATSYREERAVQNITRISHRITSTTWQTTLELTQWRK